MPPIKRMSKLAINDVVNNKKIVNWYPGHMYAGLLSMVGKLNTVDCVIEVHDARIPLTGRNAEFKKHLGMIKPHLLLLNKSDLADLSKWSEVENKLRQQGDKDVILTDLTGSEYSHATRGYDKLLNKVVELINRSDRRNRSTQTDFKVMIAGIPNVGKSTLINRLRQNHLGIKGEATRVGPDPGVTKHVENVVKICSRPPIYSLDTPGILEPQVGHDKHAIMRLSLCSSVKDAVLKPIDLAQYLLDYLNDTKNFVYLMHYEFDEPVTSVNKFTEVHNDSRRRQWEDKHSLVPDDVKETLKQFTEHSTDTACWKLIRDFRKGLLGKVMFT